jgi:hypothetical protein
MLIDRPFLAAMKSRYDPDMPLWVWQVGAIALGLSGLVLLARALLSDRARGRRRCPRCWYDMTTIDGLTCPECGRDARHERRLARTRPNPRRAAIAILVLAIAASFWLTPRVLQDWSSVVPGTVLVMMLSVWGDPPDVVEQQVVTRVQSGSATRWERLQAARWAAGEIPNAVDLALDRTLSPSNSQLLRFQSLTTPPARRHERGTTPAPLSLAGEQRLAFLLDTLSACNSESRLAAPDLIDLFDHDDLLIRFVAITCAGEHAEHAGPYIDALIDATRSPNIATSISAVNALAAIGPAARPALDRLIELSRNDADRVTFTRPGMRQFRTMNAIALIIDDDAELWQSMLEHQSSDIRSLALQSVGLVAQAHASYFTSLRAALNSPNVTGQAEAIHALGRIQPARLAIPLVIDMLEQGVATAPCVQVLYDHPEWADRSFAPVLACLQRDEDSLTTVLCIYALAELGQAREDAALAITPFLSSDSRDVAVAAALALGNLGATARPALPALHAASTNEHESLARAALQAIKAIESELENPDQRQ